MPKADDLTIGIILLLMGLIHWLLEPLEAVLTAVLSLRWLDWVVLPTVLWFFSALPGSNRAMNNRKPANGFEPMAFALQKRCLPLSYRQ